MTRVDCRMPCLILLHQLDTDTASSASILRDGRQTRLPSTAQPLPTQRHCDYIRMHVGIQYMLITDGEVVPPPTCPRALGGVMAGTSACASPMNTSAPPGSPSPAAGGGGGPNGDAATAPNGDGGGSPDASRSAALAT